MTTYIGDLEKEHRKLDDEAIKVSQQIADYWIKYEVGTEHMESKLINAQIEYGLKSGKIFTSNPEKISQEDINAISKGMKDIMKESGNGYVTMSIDDEEIIIPIDALDYVRIIKLKD